MGPEKSYSVGVGLLTDTTMPVEAKLVPLTASILTALKSTSGAALIEAWHGTVTFYCRCRPRNHKHAKLVLARSRKRGTVWFQHLGGHCSNHEPGCQFAETRNLLSPLATKSNPVAINSRFTGLFSLTSKNEALSDSDPAFVSGSRVKRDSQGVRLGPTSFVHVTLEELGLIEHHPNDSFVGRQRFVLAARALLDRTQWTFQGADLKDLIAVIGAPGNPRDWRSLTVPKDGALRFGMALGVLNRIDETNELLALHFQGSSTPIFMEREHFASLTKSLMRNPKDYVDKANVIFFGRVRSTPDGLLCDHASLVVATDRWIPVESRYELQMANMAVQRARHFTRPLRAFPHQHVHDLILHDCFSEHKADGSTDVVIEVNGFRSKRYISDKESLQAVLDVTHPGRYIFWWPTRAEPIPRFPAAYPTARITPFLGGLNC